MARHFATGRAASAALLIIVATLWVAQTALGQYTFVQDADGAGNWDDSANWGTIPPDYPDAPGATVVFNQPVRSGGGAYTLSLPASPDQIIVGSLTVNNTGANPGNFNINNGELVFQSSTSDPAQYVETASTSNNGPGRTTINSAIRVLSDLEITASNIPGLNTGTVFAGLINGDSTKTITKKGANANLQLNYGFVLGAGEGFEGKFVIDEGGIRLINAPPIAKSTGIIVNAGGQLQLGQNTTNVIPNWTMASGAVLTLNGDGKGAGNNASGALRFQLNPPANPGATSSFDNPVSLQSDARIEVQPQPTNVADPPNTGILSNVVSGAGGLIKTGPGTLVLNNAGNSYSGDTEILAGALSITNSYLADAADVLLTTGSIFNLDFAATDTIRSLYIDGVSQAIGTWGAIGNLSADFQTDLITGSGLLDVLTMMLPGLPGDYNDDDAVDAADYVIWRKNVGTMNTLPNDNGIGGEIGMAHYELWTANFGNPSAGGAVAASAAVPEPSTGLLALFALGGLLAIAIKR